MREMERETGRWREGEEQGEGGKDDKFIFMIVIIDATNEPHIGLAHLLTVRDSVHIRACQYWVK